MGLLVDLYVLLVYGMDKSPWLQRVELNHLDGVRSPRMLPLHYSATMRSPDDSILLKGAGLLDMGLEMNA